MKKRYDAALVLFTLAVLICACGSNKGSITIINASIQPVSIILDDREYEVAPEQHLTKKGLSAGSHNVRAGADRIYTPEVKKGRSTIIDLEGNNCFVVADYSGQYGEEGTGTVKVVEKFINRSVITPETKLTSDLGEKLPQNRTGKREITRFHKVDCKWIDNDQAIIDAISNLP